jgi:ferritin
MINKTVQDAINEQINKELYSSYLYLAMAAHFEAATLPGFAHWMRIQSAEETTHAMKLYDHLLERGGTVELKEIAAPPGDWGSTIDIMREVLNHEEQVTASIYEVYEVALAEKDYAAQVLLHWFINEQVEEERNASEIVRQLQRVEARETAVLMLDHRLSKRGGDE